MKILIVDNDANTVTTIKAFLTTQSNLEVDTAYGGQEGIDKLNASPIYDLVILDIMMPTISGMDVCKAMSKNEKAKNIPVLLVSALPIASKELKELLEQFQETHVVKGVLEKPFTIDSLLGQVNSIVPSSK